jgi:predicted esterase
MRQAVYFSDKITKAKLLTIACAFFSLCLVTISFATTTPSQRQTARVKGYLNSPYGYWEYLPENYNSSNRHPVVIYLHGIKEIGSGTTETELRKVLLAGPGRLVSLYNKNYPFVLISPQSPGLEEGFAPRSVNKLIEIVKNNYNVDPNRIYVTGLSYGGYATWNVAMHAHEKLAAIVPICSCGPPPEPQLLKDLPIWAFVNSGDYAIPGCMYAVKESIRNAGGNPLLTMYKRNGHNAWSLTYQDEKMWDWLLSQRKHPVNENQAPVIVNPGDQTLSIGYPSTITILATDRNNDPLKFLFEEPLPGDITISALKENEAVITVNSKWPNSYPIKVSVVDNQGGVTTQRFILTTRYSPLLLAIIIIFLVHTLVLLLPFMRQPIVVVNAATLRALGLLVKGVALFAKGNSRI